METKVPGSRGRYPTPMHVVEKCQANVGQYVKVWLRSRSKTRGFIVEGQIQKPIKKRGERFDISLVIREWGKQLGPLNRRGRPNGKTSTIKYSSIVKIWYKWDGTEEVLYPDLINTLEFS